MSGDGQFDRNGCRGTDAGATGITLWRGGPHVDRCRHRDRHRAGGAARQNRDEREKGDVATISPAARRASAQIADAKKDFTALSKEVRATLDAQYKSAGKTATPKLDELSGRALAAIALNQTGGFSRTEVSAAKAALQSREREIATGAIKGGSFAAYSQTLVTQYDAMSSEERQARGWSERTRDAAATLAAQTNGAMPSLFDQMG